MSGYTQKDVEGYFAASENVNQMKHRINRLLSTVEGLLRKGTKGSRSSVLGEIPLAGLNTHVVRIVSYYDEVVSYHLCERPDSVTEKWRTVLEMSWDGGHDSNSANALPLDLVRPFYITLPDILTTLAEKFPSLRTSLDQLRIAGLPV